MHRMIWAAVVLALVHSLLLPPPAAAAPGGGRCRNYTCDALVHRPGRSHPGTGQQRSPAAPATTDPLAPHGCSSFRMDPQPDPSDPIMQGHQGQELHLRACFGWNPGAFQRIWVTPPPVSGAELARQARDSVTVPSPVARTSPGPDGGRVTTWTGLWTWYWTTPAVWRSRSATAALGPAWATVRVRPATLTFTPGPGLAPAACAGPGRAWTPADGNAPPPPGACGYRYAHTSAGFPAELAIRWQVTWTASDGSGGRLEDIVTRASVPVRVEQIQVLNRSA